MATEKVTERSDGTTTERTVERDGGGTTVVRDGGGGGADSLPDAAGLELRGA